MFAFVKPFVFFAAMRDRHPTKHRRHVVAKAHVELILGNDELMFKQVAVYIAFSPKFVACPAETFTRHAREIAEGLRSPLLQVELEKRMSIQGGRE